MIKYQIHHKIKNQWSLEECQQHERESLNLINRKATQNNTESMKQMKGIYQKKNYILNRNKDDSSSRK